MEKIEEFIERIEEQEKEKTKTLFLRYLNKWPWFLLFIILGISAGFFIFKNLPQQFEVNSRILIKGAESQPGSSLTFDNRVESTNSNIENKIGILKSYTLYQKALDSLNWEYTWFEKELLYNNDLYKNVPFEISTPPNAYNINNIPVEIQQISQNQYAVNVDAETSIDGNEEKITIDQTVKFGEPFVNDFFSFTLSKKTDFKEGKFVLYFNDLSTLTSRYLNKTNITSDENSDFITVSITGTNRKRDADFINSLNEVFIEFGIQNRFKTSESSVEFIDSQLEKIESSLGTAEQNISNYRANNQAINLSQEAQIVYQRMGEIEQEKYLTQLQLDYYEDLLQQINNSEMEEELVNPSYVGINDPNLTNLLEKLMELYTRREELSYSVKESNPSFILVQNQIQTAQNQLEENIKNLHQTANSKFESLTERYNSIQGRLRNLPDTEKELVSRQREFDLNNELYTYMMQKKAEASISKASIAPEVQIIDNAMVESAKSMGPSMTKFLAFGFFGGFFIPFLFISLIIVFDSKIHTRNEIERQIKMPVLDGIISHKFKVKLPVIQHPRSGIAESFRGLKTNLNSFTEKNDPKIISINSLLHGEGKSFISSNFSAILTKSSNKVLLIGADLHNPTLHQFFNIKESFGLSNYLQGDISVEEIIMSTSIPNLFIVQAGPIPSNPSDLLDEQKFDYLLKYAANKFDYIIIDNAPLLLVPDAILTSSFADVSLFILRINYSHKDQIKDINKIVEFNNIKNPALLINETPDKVFGYGKKYWKKGYGEYRYRMKSV